MIENGGVYRKRVCDICGKVVYEKRLSLNCFICVDGYAEPTETFEKSGFDLLDVPGYNRITVCPSCADAMAKFVNDVHERLFGSTIMHRHK